MPFMKGAAPVRHSVHYLTAVRLLLKDRIKVFTVNYNREIVPAGRGKAQGTVTIVDPAKRKRYEDDGIATGTVDHHEGAREFVFWNLPQLQYQNPAVQVATFTDMTPSPFIKCYFEDGDHMLIDLDGRSRAQILDHLAQVIIKSDVVDDTLYIEQLKKSPAVFGNNCLKPCICEVRGQVPCPGIIPFPEALKGKHRFNKT